jgi:cell division protein FtsB
LLSFAIFYLTFHALSGERGIYALLKEDRKLEVLQAELKTVEAQRNELGHRVKLMSSGSLDLDLLDEQARSMLGVSGKDELMIPMQKDGK